MPGLEKGTRAGEGDIVVWKADARVRAPAAWRGMQSARAVTQGLCRSRGLGDLVRSTVRRNREGVEGCHDKVMGSVTFHRVGIFCLLCLCGLKRACRGEGRREIFKDLRCALQC